LIPVRRGDTYHPFLDPGWTLSFELLFYLCFACTICLGMKRLALPFLGTIFVELVAVGRVLPECSLRFLLSDEIIFEFLLGVLAARIVLSVDFNPAKLASRIPPPVLMGGGENYSGYRCRPQPGAPISFPWNATLPGCPGGRVLEICAISRNVCVFGGCVLFDLPGASVLNTCL
jgi:hypothetical protein